MLRIFNLIFLSTFFIHFASLLPRHLSVEQKKKKQLFPFFIFVVGFFPSFFICLWFFFSWNNYEHRIIICTEREREREDEKNELRTVCAVMNRFCVSKYDNEYEKERKNGRKKPNRSHSVLTCRLNLNTLSWVYVILANKTLVAFFSLYFCSAFFSFQMFFAVFFFYFYHLCVVVVPKHHG